MNRNLVNSKLDEYRERGKGTYTFCQVGCDCNIAVNLLEEKEKIENKYNKLQSNWNSLREWLKKDDNVYICYSPQKSNKTFEAGIRFGLTFALDKMNELEEKEKQ